MLYGIVELQYISTKTHIMGLPSEHILMMKQSYLPHKAQYCGSEVQMHTNIGM